MASCSFDGLDSINIGKEAKAKAVCTAGVSVAIDSEHRFRGMERFTDTCAHLVVRNITPRLRFFV